MGISPADRKADLLPPRKAVNSNCLGVLWTEIQG